jgi:hypothetical protein
VAHRTDPAKDRKRNQNTSSAGPPEQSGPPLDGPAAHRIDPALDRKHLQNSSPAAPPDWPGPPPDGPVESLAGPNHGPKRTVKKPNNFCKETPNEMKPILLES